MMMSAQLVMVLVETEKQAETETGTRVEKRNVWG